ncbi:MAG: PhzF family phenazine biosynthesis protein [Lentisphaeria bacterium]|jgi:PhzF family phenazine biosynthesis protein|nr:PhzF family phenazine biosynthesis protein [Lentisphaeria bacterium]
MRIPVYHVDAFTGRLFGGNPAAVCSLADWLPDATLQSIAAENNLSETAFFVSTGDRCSLRWFTPMREVELCGHATLAAAHVILNVLDPGRNAVAFDTASGELTVGRANGLLSMDFPSHPPRPFDPPTDLIESLGGDPLEVLEGQYPLVVYESEMEVRFLAPDMKRLALAGGTAIVTAPGEEVDFVSRFFAPGYGIPEDPVTGSAHCTLIPFWAQRKSKYCFLARQVSARGGELHCEDRGERVSIAGQAVLYMEGSIHL